MPPIGDPTRRVPLPDGRTATVDDVGDPSGTPVLYLHGTPDSRRSRHPDDDLARDLGVRLLAIDRPGYGGTDPHPTGAPPTAFAGDVAAVLDALDVRRCAVLAWSGGALDALAVTATLDDRIGVLGIAAGLVPRRAYDDPAVRTAAPARLGLLDMADELAPGDLGDAVAPMLAPWPCDRALAVEHQADQRGPADTAEVAAVPGAAERLADGLVEAVRPGLAGVAADVETQNRPFPFDLATVAAPVRLWWGTEDTVTPPPFGTWYESRLAGAHLDLVAGAAHHLPLTHWADLLRTLATSL